MAVTLRTWLRYAVPLTLLSAIACLPLLWIALRAGVPQDLASARAQVRLGWMLAASAWIVQLWLVAGVAPAVRGIARGTPLSQSRALSGGLASLARGAIPCAIAVAAILLGGVALVVPGVLLLVLLAMTGASERLGLPPPAPLADSIDVARASLRHVALLVAAIIVIDLAVALAAQTLIVPAITKKVAAAKLAPIRTFVRVVAVAVVVMSPLVACALAAAYERLRRRAR